MERFRIQSGWKKNQILAYDICAFHSIPIKSDPIRNLLFLLRNESDRKSDELIRSVYSTKVATLDLLRLTVNLSSFCCVFIFCLASLISSVRVRLLILLKYTPIPNKYSYRNLFMKTMLENAGC